MSSLYQTRVQGLTNMVINTLDYGDVITHQQIENLFNHGASREQRTNRKMRTYIRAIGGANTHLRQVGKILYGVKDVGYKVLNPDEYPAVVAQKFCSGLRLLQNAQSTAEHSPVSLMNDTSRGQISAILSEGNSLLSFCRQSVNTIVEITNADSPNEEPDDGSDVSDHLEEYLELDSNE